MKKQTLGSILVLGISAMAHSSSPFGAASNFNVFTSGYFSLNQDVEGNVAVGGNFTASGFDIAQNTPGGTALVVGGNLSLSGGTVNGNLYYAGSKSISGTDVKGSETQYSAGSPTAPLDFAALTTSLTTSSQTWAGLTQTGTVQSINGGDLVLTAASTGLNVFDITATELTKSYQVDFYGASSATYLVNVISTNGDGSNGVNGYVDFTRSYRYNGSSLVGSSENSQILWNLSDATTVTTPSVEGSILALGATITGAYGNIDGQVLAENFTAQNQPNWYQFDGSLPSGLPSTTPSTAVAPGPAAIAPFGLGVLALFRRRRKR